MNGESETVYVANVDSDSISVIDSVANKVVTGVMFDVKPFNSGYVECDKLVSPTGQYFYLWSGAECKAKPNEGFEFLNWVKNLDKNSSRILKQVSPVSANPFKPILDLFDFKLENTEATINITEFGIYTANFKALPAPIPTEYLTGLYTIVISSIVGWSIPGIISSINTKRKLKNVDTFHNNITHLYDDRRLDEKDIGVLNRIKRDVSNAYSKGKISSEHYNNLNNEISILYQDIFKKQIDAIKSKHDNGNKIKLLNNMLSDLNDAYSKEKINEKHYTLLKESISEDNPSSI